MTDLSGGAGLWAKIFNFSSERALGRPIVRDFWPQKAEI
jgi:hypothetical protein